MEQPSSRVPVTMVSLRRFDIKPRTSNHEVLYSTAQPPGSPESMINEPVHEKTNNLGFRPGPTQTGLYSHRTLLEAGNFVFK